MASARDVSYLHYICKDSNLSSSKDIYGVAELDNKDILLISIVRQNEAGEP